ncbi:hypothetical protein ACWYRQ_19370 [Clostridioides difficile]
MVFMMSMTVMAEQYQKDETSSLKEQNDNGNSQKSVNTMNV